MNKQDIIRAVGWDVYQAESQQARQAAPYTGQADAPVVYRSALPDAINTLIWYDPTRPSTAEERIALLFAIYPDLPTYALLIELGMHFDTQLSPQAHRELWQHVRTLLSTDDDTLAAPVAYMIWCDFFEFHDRCHIAWHELTAPPRNDHLTQRVLAIAGSVPFDLKKPFYDERKPCSLQPRLLH